MPTVRYEPSQQKSARDNRAEINEFDEPWKSAKMLMDYRREDDGGSGINLVRRELGDRPRVATSEGRCWDGIWLDEYGAFHAGGTEPMPPRDHHVVLIAREHSSYVLQQRLGQRFESACRPGDLSIVPAGHETTFRGRLPAHLRIGLSLERLREVAEELGRSGVYARPELANVFRAQDCVVDRLGAIMSAELLRPAHPAQDLLMESVATVLSTHLLRSFGTSMEREGRSAASNVAAIRRALEFMRQPLDIKITLAELADASGISRFHLSRIFKKHFGLSPIAYLERTRIERAKDLIRRAEMSLAEVAQTVGFADQSHFTRRFKHYTGHTPGAYSREHARKRLPS
ncbi:helix-turn-helix domain-containing protein [Bradyrhizobium sp. HKCCYLRH3099]